LQIMETLLISNKELSELLGVSQKWCIRHTYDIPGRVKLGKTVKYIKTEIMKQILTGQLLINQNK